MIPRLGCLFVVVPLIELALLIQVGRWIGVWPTVGIVALTGLLGAVLLKSQGVRTLATVERELSAGRLPGQALADGAALVMAGAFLMTPGVLTDVLAFALLLVPTRRVIQGWALARLGRAVKKGTVNVQFWGVHRMGERWGAGDPDPPGAPRRPDPRVRGGDANEAGRERGSGDEERGPGGPRPGEIIQE